jgi:hypothetical protein
MKQSPTARKYWTNNSDNRQPQTTATIANSQQLLGKEQRQQTAAKPQSTIYLGDEPKT